MAAVEVTFENFKDEVINETKPVLIDFWASWCGPCQMLGPIIEDISNEVTNVKVCKVNVDEQPQLAVQFDVMTIPTLVLMRNGKVENKSVGVIPKGKIMEFMGEKQCMI